MVYPENFVDSQNGTLTENFLAKGGRLTATNSFLHVSYSALLKFLPQQSQNSSSLSGVVLEC